MKERFGSGKLFIKILHLSRPRREKAAFSSHGKHKHDKSKHQKRNKFTFTEIVVLVLQIVDAILHLGLLTTQREIGIGYTLNVNRLAAY